MPGATTTQQRDEVEPRFCFTGNNDLGIVPMEAGVYPITTLDTSAMQGRVDSVAAGHLHTVFLTNQKTAYTSTYAPATCRFPLVWYKATTHAFVCCLSQWGRMTMANAALVKARKARRINL